MTESATSPPLSRRTLTKGVAWSVPAVTMASAAPAFAASPNPGAKAGGTCWVYNGNGTVNVQEHEVRLYANYAAAGVPGPWYYYSFTIESPSGTTNTAMQPLWIGTGYQTRNVVWS